jgi:hypothetical protein
VGVKKVLFCFPNAGFAATHFVLSRAKIVRPQFP